VAKTKGPQGIFYGEWVIKPTYYRSTGVKRFPKKGEFFLSGAIITAYKALADMSTEYWIAKEVKLVECACCKGTGKVVQG